MALHAGGGLSSESSDHKDRYIPAHLKSLAEKMPKYDKQFRKFCESEYLRVPYLDTLSHRLYTLKNDPQYKKNFKYKQNKKRFKQIQQIIITDKQDINDFYIPINSMYKIVKELVKKQEFYHFEELYLKKGFADYWDMKDSLFYLNQQLVQAKKKKNYKNSDEYRGLKHLLNCVLEHRREKREAESESDGEELDDISTSSGEVIYKETNGIITNWD